MLSISLIKFNHILNGGNFSKISHLHGLHKLCGDMAGGDSLSVKGQSLMNEKTL
jgi:hypothetical protein